MKLFAVADAIEKKRAESSGLAEHIAPKDFQEAQEIKTLLRYTRASEDHEMAQLFDQYNIQEQDFNKALEVKGSQKTRDNLPDIHIDGKDIRDNLSEYHLVKLPISDPRAYILGRITHCCQSIGDKSEQCVIDGITKENNGFYVLLKGKKKTNLGEVFEDGKINYQKYDIIGQGYCWFSTAGNLTFDSWENLKEQKGDKFIGEFLDKFAAEATRNGQISRVTIGLGGGTPEYYREKIYFISRSD